MSFLKDRAEEFLDTAKYDLSKGYYNLTLFNVEQFIQLFSKYILYLKSGDFPKTHNVLDLLNNVVLLYGDKCNIKDFIIKNKDFLYIIYFSYTQGRYFGTQFSKEDAERAIRIAELYRDVGRCLIT
ncbi:HEPN domain-containing protein [Metallosphaera hakonensis]|uniref:DNA-binding protein n=1 Tax=Metallosphaera hakonensis JCM 8857 = DSM 7519 TaxID=1293036 RepID=A0A2U9IR95_9CREN|nr:HEPN domain-containing protein [Metallosphaera hakonensis]AWR98540.1 HEPN domain-containing protein [Metallosphaera hakonensis JCM 8857 = DSM 7519]